MNDISQNIYIPYAFRRIGINAFFGKYQEISRPHLIELGNHVAIDSFFYCTTQMILGDYIHISPYTSVIGGQHALLTMEHFSGTAAGCRIICGSEDYTAGGLIGATIPKEYKAPLKLSPVTFKRFAITGTNVVIMPGVTLGEGSMIGAGAVVTKSTEPWGIYVGTPAKLVKFRSKEDIEKTLECARKLGYDFTV